MPSGKYNDLISKKKLFFNTLRFEQMKKSKNAILRSYTSWMNIF